MNNIHVFSEGLDVSAILDTLKQYPGDWNSQSILPDAKSVLDEYGFPEVDVDVLQLVIGGVQNPGDYVGDTELCIPIPINMRHHQKVFEVIESQFEISSVGRCGFLKLPGFGSVGQHVDIGSYYASRDRFHLSISGEYDYTVGSETYHVKPGTLFWFNNKLSHGTKVTSKEPRIIFVFDIQYDLSPFRKLR